MSQLWHYSQTLIVEVYIGDKEQSVCSQLEEPSCYFILCSDERKHMR